MFNRTPKLTYRIHYVLLGAFALGSFAFAPGCLASADEGNASETSSGDHANATSKEDVGSTEQAIVSGWTFYTSEEYQPVSCDGNSAFSDVQCKGDYCDNIRGYCRPGRGTRGDSYWSQYFSEETPNTVFCAGGYWVTGFACKGDYCDNIALQCTQLIGTSPINCYWTGWISEENGGYLGFGAGYYALGAQCSGDYCDNKRFYVCQQS